MTYTATQVGQIFSVTREAVRRWAVEFETHLSPTANPGDSRQRAFTDSDLEVLALVASEKKLGKRFEEIQAMLSNGQRGSAPAGVTALTINEQPRANALQARIRSLEVELTHAVDMTKEQVGTINELRRQLAEARAENKTLIGENAVLKSKGSE
ncbi:MAG: MerR family transcriptional regulator [Anaerolineae bacterium]|nr:MerR family transcriptional regulator [Anaerolineae bacterium]